LSRGAVGPTSTWAATSNVEIGRTTYPDNGERVREGEVRMELRTKSLRGVEERREWTGKGAQGPLAEGGRYLDICIGAGVSSYATADGAGLPT